MCLSSTPQIKLAIQGGEFALGDRVVCLLKAGIPPFGLRGTVTGALPVAAAAAGRLLTLRALHSVTAALLTRPPPPKPEP